MQPDREASLSDEATFDGCPKPQRSDVSLGDEQTLGGGLSGQETIIDDSEVVDLDNRYTIEGSLGRGGMGEVLLATHKELGRRVAIKRILGEAAGNRTAVQRFLTEAKSIAALNHPNVVQIYDYGRAKDGPFLIMEYVDGGSLLDRCRDGAIPLEDAVGLACQLCDGLAKAHELGIIHRDIKPANVLLTKDGTPKLTDFGLAKAQAGDHGQTMTGAVLGTPDFMPPEQRRDASLVDHRSDVWSLAATVYQMVTGRSPKIIRFKDVPDSLQDVLGKALEDEKTARYESVREFREALKSVTGGAVVSGVSVATLTDGELQVGRCKVCGTVNTELNRKFCKKCGGALRAACLACASQIPVWDMICGECGGNQPALLESRRKSLTRKRADAESLLADLAFDEAIGQAQKIAGEPLPELADLAKWAHGFVASTIVERDRQRADSAERVAQARKHTAAFDYPAAIQAIEAIPERLRDAAAAALLVDCQERRSESDRLIAEIADRVKSKETDGLLPLVERAAELRGDRQDLAKVRQQLRERRDGRVAKATAAFETGDARAAAAELGKLSREELGASALFLEQMRVVVALEEKLANVVKEAKADGVVSPEEATGILRLAKDYLAANPKNTAARSLMEQCRQVVVNTPLIHSSIGMALRRIPAGTFTMGNKSSLDSKPHPVTLSKSFFIGACPVTNDQWRQVMEVRKSWLDDLPVVEISWDEAVVFCHKLSALPKEREAGRVYRLPTEAEWEYACRAGTTTHWSFGDDESKLEEYGWFQKNSSCQTHPVAQKKPNAWGLYDMHGNVSEWCSDWYGNYDGEPLTDPQGPTRVSGDDTKVLRGGNYSEASRLCTSWRRADYFKSFRRYDHGFRVVMIFSTA